MTYAMRFFFPKQIILFCVCVCVKVMNKEENDFQTKCRHVSHASQTKAEEQDSDILGNNASHRRSSHMPHFSGLSLHENR